MNKKQEILRKLKELGKIEPVLIPALVKSVDETELTAVIEINELEFTARLNAAQESVNGFVIIPEVNSWVIAGRLDENGDVYVIVAWTAVKKIISQQNDTELIIAPEGFVINRGNYGIKKTLNDLLDAIMQLTVTTPAGPSGVPINIAAFQDIKTEITNYLQ